MTPTVRPANQWQAAAHPGPAALRGNLLGAVAQAADGPGPAGAWRRGWALTALGRYGEAWEELAVCGPPDTPYGAAAAVTRASLLRQVGLHTDAEVEDSGAAAAAPPGSEIHAAARIGLVADEVGGAGRRDELEARLASAGQAVAQTGSPRQRIRIAWVAGEVAMVAEEFGLAEGRFNAATDAAKAMGAARHHAKSLGFLAAAQAALGEKNRAYRTATAALAIATQTAALPLQWATHLILADVAAEADEHRRHAAAALRTAIESLPAPVRSQALQRPPAVWLLADS